MIECRGEQLRGEYEKYFGKFHKGGKKMAQNKFAINKCCLMPNCDLDRTSQLAHSGREKVRLFKGTEETH